MKSVKTYQFSKGKKNLFSIRKIIKKKKESKEESKNARER